MNTNSVSGFPQHSSGAITNADLLDVIFYATCVRAFCAHLQMENRLSVEQKRLLRRCVTKMEMLIDMARIMEVAASWQKEHDVQNG